MGIGHSGAVERLRRSDDAAPPAPYTLTLLHINDHHSTLESKSKTLQLDAGSGSPVAVAVDAGGFARVATAFDELARAAGPNVLKLHAERALTGTLYFNRAGTDGEADAALMNTVCFDAFTLGNHEFDKGDSGLKSFRPAAPGQLQNGSLERQRAVGLQLCPQRRQGTGRCVARHRAGARRRKNRCGRDLTVAQKAKISSSPDADTTFAQETASAQRQIDALRTQGVNKIVLMSHVGYEMDKQLAAQLGGVDVVVGGDSHTLLGPDTLKARGVGSPASLPLPHAPDRQRRQDRLRGAGLGVRAGRGRAESHL